MRHALLTIFLLTCSGFGCNHSTSSNLVTPVRSDQQVPQASNEPATDLPETKQVSINASNDDPLNELLNSSPTPPTDPLEALISDTTETPTELPTDKTTKKGIAALLGRQVITINWEVPVFQESDVIRYLPLGKIYEVTRVKGNGLWANQAVGGWISANDVMPIDDAIKHFTAKINQDPSPENFRNRGLACLALRDPDGAIRDFDAALTASPRNPFIYNSRGKAFSNKGEYSKAIEDFNFAILLDPTSAIAYNNRGNAWRAQSQNEKAVQDFNAALIVDPYYALAYNNRGNALNAQGKHQKAIDDYTDAIIIDPTYAHAYNNRGTSWSKLGEYEKAIADYRRSIALNPKHSFAQNNLAWLLATCPDTEIRDPIEAMHLAKSANNLNKNDWHILDTLAAASAAGGKFKTAITWINKAKELAPQQDLPYLNQRLRDYQAGRSLLITSP